MTPSDHELLCRYAREDSQAAFATLVQRHIDLVHSAARRQVRSPVLAEEVTQSVFVDLARSAGRIDPRTPVVAWLHLVTRRTAVDVVRREVRHQQREQRAAELEAMKPATRDWAAVEPLLDEAVDTLKETDRTAILLRYFENKSLREVGAALGTSEDTAQKRVSRAVEQLRAFFLRRGIAVSAVGLASDLSAQALHAAPAGLSAAIASQALGLPSAVAAAAHVAMTTMQKTLLAATAALVIGGGTFEVIALCAQRAELRSLHDESGRLRDTIATLTRGRAAAALAADGAPVPPHSAVVGAQPAAVDGALETELRAWFERAARLKQLLAERAELVSPEMHAFNDDERYFNAAFDARFGTEREIRETFAQMRHHAKNTLGNKLPQALRAYLDAHDGMLPRDPAELAIHCDPPLPPETFARFELAYTGKFSDVPPNRRGTSILIEKAGIDEEYDSQLRTGISGFSLGKFDDLAATVRLALLEFAKANGGAKPDNPARLLPHLSRPLRPEQEQRFLELARRYMEP